MSIDQTKTAEACRHVEIDPSITDGDGTWLTARSLRQYMGYDRYSRMVYQGVKKYNIPTREYQGKTLILMEKYLEHFPLKTKQGE